MSIQLNVDIRHLTRIEGLGNIRVRIEDGELREASWEIVETPRFFEVMLKGKHYSTAPMLTARICGICSIGHCLAGLRATEQAFGVTIPEAARELRLLAKHGETLQSHYLHLFFLAVPDFLGLPSALPLMEQAPAVFHRALHLKGLANRLCDAVAGRTTHPVSLQVGGVARMPDKKDLLHLRTELEVSLDDLQEMVELFLTFQIPDFVRETEFVSLRQEGEYAFIGGRIVSSDGVELPETEYRAATNETVTDHSTSKSCRLSRDSYAVGALARLNNNFSLLAPQAREVAQLFGLAPVNHNPFLNNIAQLVECFHATHMAMRSIDRLLDATPGTHLMTPVVPRAREGVGAVEVPRGVLFHHYEYDQTGHIVRANCVIPTTQNNADIHASLAALARQFAGEGMTDAELERLCCMLVRAYDPCISCAVH